MRRCQSDFDTLTAGVHVKASTTHILAVVWVLLTTASSLRADDSEPAIPPQLTTGELRFAIQTFRATCASCHERDGRGKSTALNLTDKIWKHGQSLEKIRQVIQQGVADTDMPAHGKKFSKPQIDILARFVRTLSAGTNSLVTPAPVDPAIAGKRLSQLSAAPFHLAPAHPSHTDGQEALVDRHIFGQLAARGIPHAKPCTDVEFVRRLYLDLWGRLPEPKQTRAFLSDSSQNKRNRLIDQLLGFDFLEKPGHVDYKGPWLVEKPFLDKWTYLFGDLFRNGQQGNARQFRDYIYTFLRFNIPYDYVVRDMLTATALTGQSSGVAGFLTRHEVDGLRCADVMHEDMCDEIALHTTRLFLGVNLECVSCHDGRGHVDDLNLYLSKRKRVDFWRQSAFFGNLRIFRASLSGQEFTLLDGPPLRPENIWRGKIDKYKSGNPLTRFGGLGYRLDAPSVLRVARDPQAQVYPEFYLTKQRPPEGVNPRHAYAQMILEHPQFAKTTVNLIWSKLMVTGIVEPIFDWDLDRQDPANPPPQPWTIQPSHPALLEELAQWFRETRYDLRLLMRTIVRSRSYQMSSRLPGEPQPDWDRLYARKLVRRLTAEEIYDALAKSTNVFGHGIQFALEQVTPPTTPSIKPFLDAFGQSNRMTKLADVRVTAVQAALLMNSQLVKSKISASTTGSLVHRLTQEQPPHPIEETVEEIFLATLVRFPSDKEQADAVAHIRAHGIQGVEDLQWALINKAEFLVNY